MDPDTIDVCRARMLHDGYFDLLAGAPGGLQWAVDLAMLADGIQTLSRHGWPPSWILMYDVGACAGVIDPWMLSTPACHYRRSRLGPHRFVSSLSQSRCGPTVAS